MTPVFSRVTTMVLFNSSGGGGGVPGGGGCGIAASKPFGVSGVIVMKMTRSTRRISIKGVTLISPLGPIFFLFLLIRRPSLLPNGVVNSFGQQTDLIDAGVSNGI